MQLLAIDVGMGTQDILLYDSEKNIENCIKLVMPSQTQIVARRISTATRLKKDIVLTGETMGGGPCTGAVKKHLDAGLRVFATEKAALTINDDLLKVKGMGIVVVNEEEALELKAESIRMQDVDKEALEKALDLFGIKLPANFAVAVQDHGFSPNVSNRVFRFGYFRQTLEKGGTLDSFVYKGNIPERFSRMKAVERTLPGALLMDTGMAAIRGALLDEHTAGPCLVVNFGNGHTLACVVKDDKPLALFEHHTHMLTTDSLDDYLKRLCNGTLGFNEVFDNGGHGCYIGEVIGFDNIGSILVTGPNRYIMKNSKLEVNFAAPFGDMMLTGCFGLMDAYLNYERD
ncbi:MAG: pyruvate formate lyase-activating protein [Candidatus Methanoperedens sp.]|nr:pyruvate formate lyase-activating protein [Candidatus Methanoperedens sp.]